MKKFFILLFLLSIPLFSKAENWDAFSDVDRMWDGQQSITNQEFEQVMNKLEEKTEQKEIKEKRKKRKNLFGNGTTLHKELNPDKEKISTQEIINSEEDLLINLPVNIILDNKILEKGYYKVVGEKNEKNGSFSLNLYQSQFFKGKIDVTETKDDFEKDTINFIDILPYNKNFIKIIFGSIDFNAYAIIPFIE